jgi:hypothetical protein
VQTGAYTFSVTGIYGWSNDERWDLGLGRLHKTAALHSGAALAAPSRRGGAAVIFPTRAGFIAILAPAPSRTGLRGWRQRYCLDESKAGVPAPRQAEARITYERQLSVFID